MLIAAKGYGYGRPRVVAHIFVLLLALCPFDSRSAPGQTVAPAAVQSKPNNVLLLYSYGRGGMGIEVFDDGLLAALRQGGISTNNLFFEYLDIQRNKADPQYRSRMLDLLRGKYANHDIGVIVTVQQPALDFLLKEGKEIAPGAPVITVQAPMPTAAAVAERRFISQLAQFDIKGTLERALEIFPSTRRVVLVSGSSKADRSLAADAAIIMAPWHGRLEFEYTFDLPLDGMLRRVASLPPNTIIIFTQYNRDTTGRVTVAYEVEHMIAESANAPVFGLYDFNLKNGGIGGSVVGVKRLGENTGQLTLDLMNGKIPLSKPVTSVTSEVIPMFDWHQIKRWGGDPSRLPNDSVFVNRVPTFIELYWRYVIGLMVFFVAQSMLIAALLANKRRRARAEQTVRESETRYRVLVEHAADAIVTGDAFGNITGWNLAAQRIFGYRAVEAISQPFTTLMPPRYRDRHREGLRRVQAGGERLAIGKTLALHGLTKAGLEFPLALSLSDWQTTEGRFFTAIMRDLTETRAAEAKIARLTDLYAALSQCNQAILTCADEEQLFGEICRIAVQSGGMKAAWVGKVDVTGQMVELVECYGEGLESLRGYPLAPDVGESAGRGPTGNAILQNQPFWCQDFLRDPSIGPLHRRAARLGWRGAAALPLHRNGLVIGAFTLLSAEVDAFDEPIRELLIEMASDVSYALDRLAYEAERRKREQVLSTLSRAIEQSPVSIVIAGIDGNIEYVNPKFEQVTGYQSAEIIGQNPRILSSGETPAEEYREMWASITSGETWQGEFHNRRKDGSLFWEQASISPILDDQGRTISFVAVKEDLTGRKASEAEIQHLAFFDALTELPNRRLLVDRLLQALASSARSGRAGALLFIDLDNFKTLNDTLGHDIGDQLLQQVAQRLSTCVREGDTVARLGGDEFVVMLDNLSERPKEAATQAEVVGAKILDTLNQSYRLAGQDQRSSPSIGITMFGDQDDSVDELLKRADMALYQAKAAGRNTLRFFDPEIQAMIIGRVALEGELRQALQEGQFLLHYQPKVSCASGKVTGFEALLRWQHPVRGLVGPATFVPMLEDTGLILPIGAWVLQTACAQVSRWHDEGLGTPSIAVNISGLQIHGVDLCETVRVALAASGLAPSYLELELTESQLMKDAEGIIGLLRRLKEMGVNIAVDDFGTGYSSLAYLKRFPIDSLKVDQAFVRGIVTEPNDVSIARAIITLAHSLKLKVVAEGVETEGQLGILIANQCDEVQGYYFSRPLPADDATELLRAGTQMESRLLAGLKRTRTLLLVDDEQNVISALQRVLRRDGYDILAASGAEQGLALLAIHPVDVIVSDQRMPGMSGVEFLRRVKVLHPDTVRMVLSGYTDLQAVTDAINEGAIYKFLTKPWDDGILRANIEEAFRNKEIVDENRRLQQKIEIANRDLANVNQEMTLLLGHKDSQMRKGSAALDIAQEVLGCLPWPIIGIDDEKTIAFANAAASALCGGEYLGLAMNEALPIALIEAFGPTLAGEGEVVIEDKRYRWTCNRMGNSSRSRGMLVVLLPLMSS